MAYQYEYGTFRGKLADKVGVRIGKKFYIRKAPPARPQNWRSDPKWANCLDIEEELRSAWKWFAAIKKPCSRLLQKSIDLPTNGRFAQLLRNNIQRDTLNLRGKRVIQWHLLQDAILGFEFGRIKFEDVFLPNCNIVDINETPTIVVEAHDPDLKVKPPTFATHYIIHAVMLEKSNQDFLFYDSEFMSDFLPVTGLPIKRTQFTFTLNPNAIDNFKIFLVGVTFWKQNETGDFEKINYGREGVAKIIEVRT
jgi:hypothetical protein